MREIVLDTETTGLDPLNGDRVIDIGCVELFNHIPTGKTYQQYLYPERRMSSEAQAISGISDDFLKDKPLFAAIADEFLEFIGDDLLIIHNAKFDVGFLNAELARINRPPLSMTRVLDTVDMARKKFPGAKASLDALCSRFGIDKSHRKLHGALLDSELLAKVYLELLGGKQTGLSLETKAVSQTVDIQATSSQTVFYAARPHRPSAEEDSAHEQFLKKLKSPLWG